MRPSNLITGDTNSLLTSVGTWIKTGAEPHTLTFSSELVKIDGKGALKITAGSSNPIHLTMTPVGVNDQFGWLSRGFCWIRPQVTASATIGVTVYSPGESTASATTSIPGGAWTLSSAWGGYAVESGTVKLSVTITGLTTGQVVYITNPVLVTPDAASRNVFAAESWSRLPDFLKETDSTQNNPSNPLLRFMDIATVSANDVFMAWSALKYIPPEDGGNEELPSILEPEYASIEVLRWWAQILGIKFYDPSTGTTPWINFMTGLDPDLITEWSDWMTGLDLSPTDGTVTWTEVQGYAPAATGLQDLLRWEIRTAYYGLRAGTKEAILECVKKVLTGTKTARLVTHVDGDAWKFKVETIQSETPDSPALGASSATIEAIVANAVPVGFQFIHETDAS